MATLGFADLHLGVSYARWRKYTQWFAQLGIASEVSTSRSLRIKFDSWRVLHLAMTTRSQLDTFGTIAWRRLVTFAALRALELHSGFEHQSHSHTSELLSRRMRARVEKLFHRWRWDSAQFESQVARDVRCDLRETRRRMAATAVWLLWRELFQRWRSQAEPVSRSKINALRQSVHFWRGKLRSSSRHRQLMAGGRAAHAL